MTLRVMARSPREYVAKLRNEAAASRVKAKRFEAFAEAPFCPSPRWASWPTPSTCHTPRRC